jgi:hypothetical protein
MLALPRLRALTIADPPNQAGIDALATAAHVEHLLLAFAPGTDLRPLARMPALTRLKLAAPPDASAVGPELAGTLPTVLRQLLARGVEIVCWENALTRALAPRLAEFTMVSQSGMLALTSNPKRSPALAESLRMNLFPWLDPPGFSLH